MQRFSADVWILKRIYEVIVDMVGFLKDIRSARSIFGITERYARSIFQLPKSIFGVFNGYRIC